MLIDNHLKNLQTLGLNFNQAKIYLALIPELSLTTDELVEKTQIARTKIYSDLKKLESDGWIIREEGRPIKYIPIDPNSVFRENFERLLDQFQATENYILAKWEERGRFQTQPINVFSGEEFLRRETLNEISNAKREIIIILEFVFPDEINEILLLLQKRKMEGIFIRFVIDNEVFERFNDKIKEKVKDFKLVKIAPIPVRSLIIDQHHALISFRTIDKEKSFTETINISYPNFIKLMQKSVSLAVEQFDDVL